MDTFFAQSQVEITGTTGGSHAFSTLLHSHGETYWNWIRRFILFHGKKHPKELGAPEVRAFLTHLAADKNVAVSTQSQAFPKPK